MEEKSQLNEGSINCWVTMVATIAGAGFGFLVGRVFVMGFWAGLIVLVTTVLGALAGRYCATRE